MPKTMMCHALRHPDRIRMRFSLLLAAAGSLLTVLELPAQNLNLPYPRFGIFTFSGMTSAGPEILKDFSVVTLNLDNAAARRYKARNPNQIVLANAAMFINERLEQFKIPLPEAWFYHDTGGNRMQLWDKVYQMNISSYCPAVDMGDGRGPQQYSDFALNWLRNNLDFTAFDGTFHDWWWSRVGSTQQNTGDFNGNGIADKTEWGSIDSVNAVYKRGMLSYHSREAQIPGLDYVVVQIGIAWAWPSVNGSCFEDWPMYNGPFSYWIDRYNDTKTLTREPKLMLFNGSHRFFHSQFPVEPYKNNYRAVRYGLASCLMTSAFFYVDEGNTIGHHGNVHIYDEFESKGELGYPRTEPMKLPGKTLAATPWASGVWVRFFDNGVSVVNATGRPQTVTASELAMLDPVTTGRYHRFLGGQDPDFNNGKSVTDADPVVLWGDNRKSAWADPEVFGDGILLFRTRRVFVTPIVVDNHVNNQTSPGSDPVQYTGGWVLSSDGGDFYAFYTGRNYAVFQPDGFAWSPPGQGENKAVYSPSIGVPGLYEVFEWHGYRGASPGSVAGSTAVPFTIVHAAGDTTLTVNQSVNRGKWNSLGVYSFAKGKTGRVEMLNQSSQVVLSDAVRFVFRGVTIADADFSAPVPPQGVRVTPAR